MEQSFIEQFRTWFLLNQRKLPWRQKRTPYRVLVSEVMLQQTQASRVALYFDRWMKQFPTLENLAKATLSEVYKAWEGLGYYSRARSLHQMAQSIVDKHNSIIPNERERLLAIRGIGPYTVNALLAFAFGQNVAAVDANVVRVICRLFAVDGDVKAEAVKNQIQLFASSLIPENKGYEIAEALIELGATVCKKSNPECTSCPFQKKCRAFQLGKVAELPLKNCKTKYEKLYRDVAIIRCGDLYLVKKEIDKKLMQGLYQFPYIESSEGGSLPEQSIAAFEKKFEVSLQYMNALPDVQHSFTRFRATLYPKIMILYKKIDFVGYEWCSCDLLTQLAFSSGHRRIIASLLSQL